MPKLNDVEIAEVGCHSHECANAINRNFRGAARNTNRGDIRIGNLIEQQADQSEESTDEETNKMVLHVAGDGLPRLY